MYVCTTLIKEEEAVNLRVRRMWEGLKGKKVGGAGKKKRRGR